MKLLFKNEKEKEAILYVLSRGIDSLSIENKKDFEVLKYIAACNCDHIIESEKNCYEEEHYF